MAPNNFRPCRIEGCQNNRVYTSAPYCTMHWDEAIERNIKAIAKADAIKRDQ